MQTKSDVRTIISNNIVWLMNRYGVSRKQLCSELDIKYTTLCDWISAKTYPRVDAMEALARYFSVDISLLFTDISKDDALVRRLTEYARRLTMKETYESTYPAGFFDLFGSLSESDIEEPERLIAEERENL